MFRSNNRWLLVFALGPLSMLAACQDNLAPPFTPEEGISGPLFVQAPSFSGTLTPTDSKTSLGPIVIGSYPHATKVVVTVTGLLTQFYGPDPAVWGSNAGTAIGPWDAAGLHNGSLNQCLGNVAISSSILGFVGFCDYGNTQPITTPWTTTVIMQGDVIMSWVRGPASFSSVCDGPSQTPCFTYTGQFSVSVVPLSADLYIQATPEVMTSGQSVTLQAYPLPSGVPFIVQNWSFLPDAGGPAQPMCGTLTTCAFTPAGSGTMTVNAIVNGVPTQKTRRVLVNGCPPTGDPRLDNPDFRNSLTDLFNQTYADPNRVERGFRWWRNVNDGSHRWEPATANPATNCHRNTQPGPGGLPGEQLDSHGHSHGYNRGDAVICQGSTVAWRFDPVREGGGSAPDWTTVNNLDGQLGTGIGLPPIPGWTVDGQGSWRLDPNTPANLRPSNPNKWTRQPNGCYQ